MLGNEQFISSRPILRTLAHSIGNIVAAIEAECSFVNVPPAISVRVTSLRWMIRALSRLVSRNGGDPRRFTLSDLAVELSNQLRAVAPDLELSIETRGKSQARALVDIEALLLTLLSVRVAVSEAAQSTPPFTIAVSSNAGETPKAEIEFYCDPRLLGEHGVLDNLAQEPRYGLELREIREPTRYGVVIQMPIDVSFAFEATSVNVLIAEDNMSVREVMMAALRSAGHVVRGASDAEGLRLALNDRETPIDVLVVSGNLLGGSIQSFSSRVAANPNVASILVISGDPRVASGPAPERTWFLIKPFRIVDLLEKIHEITTTTSTARV